LLSSRYLSGRCSVICAYMSAHALADFTIRGESSREDGPPHGTSYEFDTWQYMNGVC
jgi:hypothetical protein